ncbi:baseplate J/gp47 family protein [Lysinibacillus mangiferihumi]|uniref:Baseplate J/gp47 family protein n=1 Tax=Lysinibacillus mangiferihumi TaxID=1130819 RepID=A0A4U2ZFI7_9BACI|nr:baseplate J/gp47 family protein [Lysinibacillus mangiferihumi]TKI72652.1 baseplate J/gp47 family protein [Lysinibacillus mangiferihumi]
MVESTDFIMPEFLKNATEEYFTQMALSKAPTGIDTSEGQMFFDHTKPTAIIATEITQFHLSITLQMMFPQFATGKFLEWHGAPYHIFRRGGTNASGKVKLKSKKEGQVIPTGTIVYTLGDDTESAKEYKTTENVVINNGEAIVRIEAIESGNIGNTAARTVVTIQRGYEVDNIINLEPITGGTEAESDESLRERILNRIALAPLSGARRDYERWAKEVDGVGNVIVQPLWKGPRTVRVLITDANNQFANDELMRRVKEYIDPEEFEGLGEGKAPIGAIVTVGTIEPVVINITARIYFEEGADPTLTLERAKNNMNRGLLNAMIVRTTEVGASLIETEGVLDYQELNLNSQTDNIVLTVGQRAVIGEVVNSGS